MGAKTSVFLLAALLASACAGELRRFAPPGLLKYEDLAEDEPVNPAIAEAIRAEAAEPAQGFPDLSGQPSKLPEGIAAPERKAMAENLIEARDDLAGAVAEDRAAAAALEQSLDEARDQLRDAAERDQKAARKERANAPGGDLR